MNVRKIEMKKPVDYLLAMFEPVKRIGIVYYNNKKRKSRTTFYKVGTIIF